MREIITVFTALFIINILFLLIFLLKSYSLSKLEEIKSNSGIFLIDIDLKKNRMRKSDLVHVIKKDVKKNKNLEFFEEGWMDISTFLSNISEENREKFLSALDAIKINKKYAKFVVKNESQKELNYSIQWIVEFFQSKGEINATIEWSYVKNLPKDLNIITKEELYNNTSPYKSFIAFNLKTKDQNNFKSFIIILFENLKLKNINFFVSKNIVILIVYGLNSEEIEGKIKKILEKIEKIKISKQLIYYYDAIGIVESKGVTTPKDLLKIINRIYFSLIKSTQLNKTFHFNMKNIFFNEFEEFKENYLILNNLIKYQKIKSIEIPILEAKTGNIIANYIKPKPEYPNNFWTDMIVNNESILPNINDAYLTSMLNSLCKLDQYLIDVNDYSILKNIDKIQKLTSMLFIITFLESSNIRNLELITETLKNRGIKFGIRVENIVPEVITIIESIIPHAVIIGKNLLNSSDLRMFLNLKQLIALCNKNPATLIFESPSEFELSNKLIKYYYNYDE